MAGHENEMESLSKTNFLNEQTDEAKAKLIYESNVYPNHTVMNDLPQPFQNVMHLETSDNIQQENEDVKQTKHYTQTEVSEKRNNHEVMQDINDMKQESVDNSENKETVYSIIAKNSFEMRLKVLDMEINVVNKICANELNKNEKDIKEKLRNIEKCIDVVSTVLSTYNFIKADNELLTAENLSGELMRKIKEVIIKKAGNKEEVQTPEDDIQIPDYRSIVTVRGTKEDVANCILKAQTALKCGKFERARKLLLKAERILPTKNARDLLKEVEAAWELKDCTAVTEEIHIVRNIELKSERDNISTSEIAHTDDSKKVERNSNDAKTIDPYLNRQSYTSKRSPVIASTNLIEAKSKIRKIDKPMMNKTFKDQGSLEEDKNKTDKRAENDADFLNTAVEHNPTPLAKELPTKISNNRSLLVDTNAHANDYQFLGDVNESNTIEASKCIIVAQAAIQKSQYDRAEHFLIKSQRICDSETAKSLLKSVQNARVQNNTNVTMKTETNVDEYGNTFYRNEVHEYRKCIMLTTKAIAENDLVKAEKFLTKAIRINPNDEAKKQLHNIQAAILSQNSSSLTTTSTTVKNVDPKRVNETEILVNLCVNAKIDGKFDVARYYVYRALQKQPNETTRKQLLRVQTEIERRNLNQAQSENDFKVETHKLLDKAERFISKSDFEKAEFYLIISWDMCKVPRTTEVHKQFLSARIAVFEKQKGKSIYGRYNGNLENMINSDKLVMSAMAKHENNKLIKAKALLIRASEFHPSPRIKNLLDDYRKPEIKRNQSNEQCCIML